MLDLRLDPSRRAFLGDKFLTCFDAVPTHWFSAPGRAEIGGNHTDHQRGRVLAAAVNLDTVAAVRPNGQNCIRVASQGYALCTVDLDNLEPVASERNTSTAIIRGVAARFAQLGCAVGGFDACISSQVRPGSGLSSSAAFEVLLATVINHLFFAEKADPVQLAKIGQYAENVYFGKPCGLMDQMASAVGGLVSIDFADAAQPDVKRVDFDFAGANHALCIIDSRASHAGLTAEYAAIPAELRSVCEYFGKEVLTEVPEAEFYASIFQLRRKCGDRAVLRAMHVYADNARVPQQVEALQNGDFDRFLQLVTQSGHSSFMYLQNAIPAGGVRRQDIAVALAFCEHYLQGRGAYRIHGGGFAGTVQAFVPTDLLEGFRRGIESVLGAGACHVLSIRPQGGVRLA